MSSIEKELEGIILQEKARGTSDLEIGRKYGVTFRYIERLITKSQGVNISAFKVPKKVKTLYPRDFEEEKTTVWSFKQRGNWATHSGEYRGNWSPYIPRNVILKYSKPGDLVLDYFCGAGTTAVESKLLGRRCIAFDINDKAIELAKQNVDFAIESQRFTSSGGKNHLEIYEPELSVGNAKELSFLQDNSVDLICAHPPYANIIHYTNYKASDLSFLDIDDFLQEMAKVAQESFRTLKPGRQCAILIGDTRRKKHVIPLGFKLINVYLDAGFKLRELVIKRQHNCKTTGFWHANSIKYNFLLLAHEYLPVFEKPKLSILSNAIIRERVLDYSLVFPTLGKPQLDKKLDGLETTTVWVFSGGDFEECLNRNVIDRYSYGSEHVTMTFPTHVKKNGKSFDIQGVKNKTLLFIKSPFLNDNASQSKVEAYLQKIDEIIKQGSLKKGGFLAIQTQDVRIDGYIEPVAKRVVDMLTFDNLWLKEIVVVTQNGLNLKNQNSTDYLKMAHQYLLIYEITR